VIDAGRVDVEQISGRAGQQHPVGQRPAQPGDQRLQGVAGTRGRVLAPDAVDEPGGGDDPARLQREQGHQPPQARAADLDGRTAVGAHLEGTQQPDPHDPSPVVDLPAGPALQGAGRGLQPIPAERLALRRAYRRGPGRHHDSAAPGLPHPQRRPRPPAPAAPPPTSRTRSGRRWHPEAMALAGAALITPPPRPAPRRRGGGVRPNRPG
jgi:hypothetical protein